MKKSEIADKLYLLSEKLKTTDYDKAEFVYDFLLSFGLPKATITRLKKGDYDLSDEEGEVFHRRKLFFKVITDENPLLVIDELAKHPKIEKHQPRFLMVTDYEKIFARDTKLQTNKEFEIERLSDHVDFFLPLSGAEIYRVVTDTKADRDAAYQLGELYDLLVEENPEWVEKGSHNLNVFLSRILFCFYAEDTGIFEQEDIFTESLGNNTQVNGKDTAAFLDQLFQVLDTKEDSRKNLPKHLEAFPYVNGGLFRDHIHCPNFSYQTRKLLIKSGELDWADINPDIFGSMIQAVADPEERTHLGMHYTSVENILKVIKPLFLDELYEKFEKNKEKPKKLEQLLHRISKMKFFDPACGSGNFLIITYKELRLLEIRIIQQLIAIQKQTKTYYTQIRLAQFYGIEIKDFAHEMAILSLWLAEHQMNQVFMEELDQYAQIRPILPLQQAGNIVVGNAARLNWEEVCPIEKDKEVYVFGNPPYLGSRYQEAEHRDDMTYVLGRFKTYKRLDYITIWFYKGSNFIRKKNAKLAFVSTNSVIQGEQVFPIWTNVLQQDLEIFFAYQSFKWTNNAKGNAGVTVVIIGLRNHSNELKLLYAEDTRKVCENINGYLLDAEDIYIQKRSTPLTNSPKIGSGNRALDNGHLLLSEAEKNALLQNYPKAEKIIKPVIGAAEFLQGKNKYCLWIYDEDLELAESILPIKKRINEVQKYRSKRKNTSSKNPADFPHQFLTMKMAEESVLFLPTVSSERRQYIPCGLFDNDTVIIDPNFAIYDPEPFIFGIISSKMHMVWMKNFGGKLETRYRYSSTLCYNTFPFPEISKTQKESLRQYVFDVLGERAKYSEKTMAYLYDPDTMPEGLKQAHQALDEAVERIYRLTPFRSDEERLEYLFKEYEKMMKKETLFAKQKKKGKRKK